MTADAELISKITEAVLAALAQRAAAPAAIHAPVGVCTGDYSKFTELASNPVGATTVTPTPAAMPVESPGPTSVAAIENQKSKIENASPVLTGIITATRLAGLEGTIYLAPGAKLSPLAQDLVKHRGLTVCLAAAAPAKKSGESWLYWMQGYCPSAARIVDQFHGRLIDANPATSGEQLPAVVRRLDENLGQHGARLAVLFVPTAARAVALAARSANLRPVVATCPRSVREGIDQIGANVLVLEYPPHGFKAMAEMMELFLTSPGAAPATWRRQLEEAHAKRIPNSQRNV